MRNGFVDVARFFGALGIVWFHAGATAGWIGYSGLPLFLALAIYFTLETAEHRPLGALAMTRCRRLLGPFIAWSAIFLLVKSADDLARGAEIGRELRPWMLLTGTSLHLWFLPFVFVLGTAVVAFSRAMPDARLRGAAHLGLAVGALGLCAAAAGRNLVHPLGEWAVALPPVFLGAALHSARGRPGMRAAMVGVFVAATLILMPPGSAGPARPLVLSAIVLLLCLSVFVPAGALSSRLALLSFGIYLVHPLMIAAAARIPAVGPVEVAVLSMAGATLAAMLLQKTPLRVISA